ncbi:MAG: DUF3987 domain-containing protein [Bacteroidetes bacterium]|nr:DUF3987 domain-containing protein [Bacteroidota bacterium]
MESNNEITPSQEVVKVPTVEATLLQTSVKVDETPNEESGNNITIMNEAVIKDTTESANVTTVEVGEKASDTIDNVQEQIEQDVPPSKDRKVANFANDTLEPEVKDALSYTPCFPHHIYAQLPEILKESARKFDNPRERDVYLLSALTVLSGCFPMVTGEYGQRKVYSNLFSFVVAPAASGKGVMVFAKQLGSRIHNKLVEESKNLRLRYNIDLKAYKSLEKKSEKDTFDMASVVPPVEPQSKVLFIPADISSTRLIDHLYSNGGNGILVETEADTLAGSLKQDWGGYSDKLRKSFQHEPIAYSRKGGSEFKEVENPRLSVALSGTPSQVSGIIRSVSDGLFSRFGFYTFNGVIEWKSAFPKNGENLTDYFDLLAEKIANVADSINQSPIKFSLSLEQMTMLDEVCSAWLKESYILLGEDAKASAIRLGLILYRIAMTLSILRIAESQNFNADIVCENTDFNTAIEICQILKEHFYTILRQLPKSTAKKETKHKAFLDALPPASIRFRRKEAVTIGQELGLSSRTVDNYLKDLVQSKFLESPTGKPGLFVKMIGQETPQL